MISSARPDISMKRVQDMLEKKKVLGNENIIAEMKTSEEIPQKAEKMKTKIGRETSLVVHWLRLCTSNTRGPGIQSLVRELDPTCHN